MSLIERLKTNVVGSGDFHLKIRPDPEGSTFLIKDGETVTTMGVIVVDTLQHTRYQSSLDWFPRTKLIRELLISAILSIPDEAQIHFELDDSVFNAPAGDAPGFLLLVATWEKPGRGRAKPTKHERKFLLDVGIS